MTEAWWFLQPGNILLMLVVLAFLSLLVRLRGLAVFLLFCSLIIAMLPTVFGVSDWLGWQLERQVPKPEQLPVHVDGILVLGGSVEWQISREQGQLNLNAAAERMTAAVALAKRYPEAQLVLTGVYRDTLPADLVASGGIQGMFTGPEFAGSRVTFIGEATSTYQEGLLAVERLQPSSSQTWILVTSAMHMPRAQAVFSTLGWNMIPFPVDYRTPATPRLFSLNMNFSYRLAHFDEVVREWAALWVYRRTGRIQ